MVTLDSSVSSSEHGHWVRHTSQGAGGTKGVGQVRRTAAIIAAGALLFLTGCQGDDDSGGSQATATKAAPAKLSLTVANGATDVSPAEPLGVAVSDGKLGDVTVVDGNGA